MDPIPDHQSDSTNQFKAETRQLLNILIHSLYSEREVFLRELISNASDALTRLNFEMLTNREIINPEMELGIWILTQPDENLLIIKDSGIGMTAQEMSENLGTIAHSGARAFLEATQKGAQNPYDIIGQFGVGFYSAFMVSEWIKVISRSFQPEAEAAEWFSNGEETYTIKNAGKEDRGTEIWIKLKPDAVEYTDQNKLKDIIKRYSDYVPFPIYLGDNKEQANRQTALWRKQPREVQENEYHDFFKQFTLDVDEPLSHLHLVIDAPVQLYALLYIPSSPDRSIFSLRKKDGLRLYARKVLIQDYAPNLLPDFLRFIQGVVDSEDIPLNISRETFQASTILPQINKILANKIVDSIKTLSNTQPEKYETFWQVYHRFIKEGIATDPERRNELLPLLRFHTMNNPSTWISLDQYIEKMKPGQEKIYYLIGLEDTHLANSPHLELLRKEAYDVLFLADPIDPFWLYTQHAYQDHPFSNAATDKLPEEDQAASAPGKKDQKPDKNDSEILVQRFKAILGNRVADVRSTRRLVTSPARLVDKEGELNVELQHVYRLLNKEYKPPEKILELNTLHPLLVELAQIEDNNPLSGLVIEQVYENALLAEGLHPDPAKMIGNIQKLLEIAVNQSLQGKTPTG